MSTALAVSIFALGALAGFILRSAITTLADYRDQAPAREAPTAQVHPTLTRWSASDILGCGDQPPTYPGGLKVWRRVHPVPGEFSAKRRREIRNRRRMQWRDTPAEATP